uniref:zinc transporter ZIP11-like isoform X1 n=2 Tax=Myxine glutinosa TaxID=7769 RepID=UPI00358F126C
MWPGLHPLTQTLLGTGFTWAVTAAGASLVFVLGSAQREVLDGSLGFAAGVMLAASYWSLLAPAIELAEAGGYGTFSWCPVAVGFALGATFVYLTDVLLPNTDFTEIQKTLINNVKKNDENSPVVGDPKENLAISMEKGISNGEVIRRKKAFSGNAVSMVDAMGGARPSEQPAKGDWHRIMLLVMAITVHNIPEGLAVGVGFGAIGRTESATFEKARSLAIGIGIQNFPEGLAVSLPLRGMGVSSWKAFCYGQLSGMVEPLAGVLGAGAVVMAEPLLPYALAFAAGAMIYVVIDAIIPESHWQWQALLLDGYLGFCSHDDFRCWSWLNSWLSSKPE